MDCWKYWKGLSHRMQSSAASKHTLVCLVTTRDEGLAFVFPPAGEEKAVTVRSRVISLPHMSSQTVEGWLVRRNDAGQVLGGFQLALSHTGIWLLQEWIRRAGTMEQGKMLLRPFHEVADAVPEEMGTLRQALRWIVECWRAEADVLSGGGVRQQEAAKRLQRQLTHPLEELLDQGSLEGELSWFLYEAELEWLLPQLSDIIMVPVREWLNNLGFDDPNQPITFAPLGRLGLLPLHKALVPDPRSGKHIPFQKTCRLIFSHLSS